MKNRILLIGLAFSLCALGHASAATIGIDDVESFKIGKHPAYSFNLNIEWDKGVQNWSDLSTSWKTEGGKTFSTKGVTVVREGARVWR